MADIPTEAPVASGTVAAIGAACTGAGILIGKFTTLITGSNKQLIERLNSVEKRLDTCQEHHIECTRQNGELSGRLDEQRKLLSEIIKLGAQNETTKVISRDPFSH